jgi:hypothetical protein
MVKISSRMANKKAPLYARLEIFYLLNRMVNRRYFTGLRNLALKNLLNEALNGGDLE